MSDNNEAELAIDIHPTPNPNALKFILNNKVKSQGSSNYKSPLDCGENNLALELFSLRGVDQVHFFDNVITITKFNYQSWDELDESVTECLNKNFSSHNPDYYDPDPEAERREKLTPELQDIESILDKTIRPGLQADGGDLHTISYEDNVLLVRYQGACGTCPSSTTGTLGAIKQILRDEYNPEIDVYIAPEI